MRDLLHYLEKENLEIVIVGSKPTFITASSSMVLDITFSNDMIGDTVRDWRVSKEPSILDHM